MSAQEVFVQQFARLFQHYNEALAPSTQGEAELPQFNWHAIPHEERNRLVGAARLALLELVADSDVDGEACGYYAKPGEAEWGC